MGGWGRETGLRDHDDDDDIHSSCPILKYCIDQLSLHFRILYGLFQVFYALADVGFDGV